MKTQPIYLSILAFIFLLSGCGRSAVTKNQFAISPENISKQPKQLEMAIEVRQFSINPLFSSKQFVYRVSDFKYKQDYYNEFLISPAVMMTEATRSWLSQTGMYPQVLGTNSTIKPSCTLQGSVAQCYADVRDKNAPAAVLKIQLFLIKKGTAASPLIWNKTYDIKEPMKDRSAESFIAALNQCLRSILQNMQTDISDLNFENSPDIK
jgi:cholesterol transport system auxiliary component